MSDPVISMIVAMDKNRLIGADNKLPWRLPDDMKWFVKQTMGKPVIMGRKTYDSIPKKFKPLHSRLNIILTRNPDYKASGCVVVHTVQKAIAAAGDAPEIIVGGGGMVYELFLPVVDRLYLTVVEGEFAGDAYFPEMDTAVWREVYREEHGKDGRHAHAFTWLILEGAIPKCDKPINVRYSPCKMSKFSK